MLHLHLEINSKAGSLKFTQFGDVVLIDIKWNFVFSTDIGINCSKSMEVVLYEGNN